ncbi:MAG: hypothetical protein ACI4OR_01400 [Alphaproteobacteria bacterium]
MRELFKNLMNLDTPVLTEKLAPKIAPYAKIIYLVILVILGLTTISSLGMLLMGNIGVFLVAIFWVVVQFAIVRMFCEYLTSSAK